MNTQVKNVTICSDYNYIFYSLTLLRSLFEHSTIGICVHFLCLDSKTHHLLNIVKEKFKYNIKLYNEDILNKNLELLNLKIKSQNKTDDNDGKYYIWSLASQFTWYIIEMYNYDSITYIDADHYFHLDSKILFDSIGSKDVAIFRHRFPDANSEDFQWGKFNVGVVYFKNSAKAMEVLEWWKDAVLFRKYPELAVGGDQKYLDNFPKMCNPDQIAIDPVGPGAPWNWNYCDLSLLKEKKLGFNGEQQDLVFTHFSRFLYDPLRNSYDYTHNFSGFTNNKTIYFNKDLKELHRNYFKELQKTKKIINKINNIPENNSKLKIAIGMIVFEGDYVLKECLEQLYPHVEQILIAEGPVKYWQDQGRSTSTDNTNNILDNFPDPENKLKVVHGQFLEKDDQSNAYMNLINDDIDYLWMVDSDEVYTTDDIIRMKEFLEDEKPTSVGLKSLSFFGGFEHTLTGFELKKDNFIRVFKYYPGCTWITHRPPTIKYENPKHISSEELYEKTGIQMFHYSYVFPDQVYKKTNYYKSWNKRNIENHFEKIYLPWVRGDLKTKEDIEYKYRGVHEWDPEIRGDCYTTNFILCHPEAVEKNMDELLNKFNYQLNNLDTLNLIEQETKSVENEVLSLLNLINKHNIQQIYISAGIDENTKNIANSLNQKIYNLNEPVLFVGLYNFTDFQKLSSYKGEVYVLWHNNDCNPNIYARVSLINKIRSKINKSYYFADNTGKNLKQLKIYALKIELE